MAPEGQNARPRRRLSPGPQHAGKGPLTKGPRHSPNRSSASPPGARPGNAAPHPARAKETDDGEDKRRLQSEL